MFKKIQDLSIRIKLFVGFGFVLLASIVIGVTSITGFVTVLGDVDHTIEHALKSKDINRQINVAMLMARRSEKDFLMRVEQKYVDRVKKAINTMDSLVMVGIVLDIPQADRDRLSVISELGDQYLKTFIQVVDATNRKGAGDLGIVGRFRGKVHQVESLVIELNALNLQVEMLTLRRHEKDYLLRGKDKYVTRFSGAIDRFKVEVKRSNLRTRVADQLILTINEYQTLFSEVVAVDQEIAGTIAKFRKVVHLIEPLIEEGVDQASQLAVENTQQLRSIMTDREYIIIITLVITIILGALIALGITSAITRPINATIDMLKDIEKGEGDLTKRLNIQSKDEIGTMADLFDSFIAKTQTLIRNIATSSKEVDSASAQISAASEQLASGAEEQQAQLSEVATTMEEMSAMILEASKNADDTKNQVKLNGEVANEGRDLVAKTVTGFESVAKTVSETSRQIDELSRRSEEIGNVIQVIDDIADQTNLLALNANIEAARAGDAGRGFAVVADEVRKLAERTVSATAEISQMIESIQGDISNAVKSMEATQEQSSEGLELVAESDKSLEKIAGGIGDVVSAVELIATSTNEQSSGAEEISRNIEGVSTVAKESASSAQELAASAEQLSREVTDLNKLVRQFKVD